MKFITDYPEISTLIIATFFTGLGVLIKTIIDYFLEGRRRKVELRRLFWKEKLDASKKATEFYYEHLAFLNLVVHKLELDLNEQDRSIPLTESLQERIHKLSNKTFENINYEHHHINLFYGFDETKLNDINRENFVLIQKIHSIEFKSTESKEQFEVKSQNLIDYTKELKGNFEKIITILRDYMNIVRLDIKKFIE